MINFAMHEARAGGRGATEDFEQMLALLIQSTYGDAHVLLPNPGDWGIDVFVGRLDGQVMVWQAKYFRRGVTDVQRRQIDSSFSSAMRAAAARSYRVTRWVLCIPSNLDGPATQWWQRWKDAREREHELEIDLWDETRLRDLLSRPGARHVRESYYDLGRHTPPDENSQGSPARWLRAPAAPASNPSGWTGGAELRFGGSLYLVHDDAVEIVSRDRSWVWREATADRIEPSGGRVRLRQVEILRPSPAAEQRHRGLSAQAALQTRLAGAAGLPRLADVRQDARHVTVASASPPGLRWSERFGPAATPPDRVTAAAALAAASNLCRALEILHRHDVSHRTLQPDGIMVAAGDRCTVRDLGLAGLAAQPGEGADGYRAPEQVRAGSAAADARTDVYQLAAVLYHTLTAHPAALGTPSPPVRAVWPGLPDEFDQVMASALDPDPQRRPPDVTTLARALGQGRQALSRSGQP